MLRGYIPAYCACFSTAFWQSRKENGPFLDSQNEGKSQGFCPTYHISGPAFADLCLWVLSIALPVGNSGDSVLDADKLGSLWEKLHAVATVLAFALVANLKYTLCSTTVPIEFSPVCTRVRMSELESDWSAERARLRSGETWWNNPASPDISAVMWLAQRFFFSLSANLLQFWTH